MAENLAPDAIVSVNAMTGAVGNVQDSPDTPDANWITADATANCECTFSFGTPSDNIDGAQQFRVLVRRIAPTAGADPDITIVLQSAGVDTAVTTTVPITEAAATAIATLDWTDTDVSDQTGANVEVACRVIRSGGTPSGRRIADIGAVEWVASVAAAPAGSDLVAPIVQNYRNMGFP